MHITVQEIVNELNPFCSLILYEHTALMSIKQYIICLNLNLIIIGNGCLGLKFYLIQLLINPMNHEENHISVTT